MSTLHSSRNFLQKVEKSLCLASALTLIPKRAGLPKLALLYLKMSSSVWSLLCQPWHRQEMSGNDCPPEVGPHPQPIGTGTRIPRLPCSLQGCLGGACFPRNKLWLPMVMTAFPSLSPYGALFIFWISLSISQIFAPATTSEGNQIKVHEQSTFAN